MSILKSIEEVAVDIQQQLVGGAGCSCSCSCYCHCGYSDSKSSNFTKDRSASREGRFRGLRG